jgi:UDP-N-acetylmuramoyl-L-alanyl-D-glutamate--2,6-diaminopimelate ligase
LIAASAPRRKRLSDCVGEDLGIAPFDESRDVWIGGVATDSRRVRPGDLFIATRGAVYDGHDFIAGAVANGAVAILLEHDAPATGVLQVKAPDTRTIAGRVAARFYDHPSRAIGCIGITGTNGKTSVSHFIAALLSAAGQPSGYAGTLGWGYADKRCAGDLTTEDAVTMQRRLADLVSAGAQWVAMEASSHALDQDRVADVAFDIAVFTNLTRDHLDYHGTMDRYAAAKRRLFDWPTLQGGVVNWDDPQGRIIYRDRHAVVNILRFGTTADADLYWTDLSFDATGTTGRLMTPWGARSFRLPLLGEFNVANFAAAVAAACLAGAAFDDVIAAASGLMAPVGRMQAFGGSGMPRVVVDFAHTPDALGKALAALRRHSSGRVLCVFGCGGDRDRGKRPLMARAAEAGADHVWVTNDNPRSEDPADIAADIAAGFQSERAFEVELDRATAIERAIASAAPSDIVLVAGKGHESYQEIAGRRVAYQDSDVVQRVLRPEQSA